MQAMSFDPLMVFKLDRWLDQDSQQASKIIIIILVLHCSIFQFLFSLVVNTFCSISFSDLSCSHHSCPVSNSPTLDQTVDKVWIALDKLFDV
mmetsp:Transcript_24649/g.55695  ORF Transcript_24649/g.55695 Transcript_24649/m.55695 type:complete len:92 (-) Transcript_24649:371-646(-)